MIIFIIPLIGMFFQFYNFSSKESLFTAYSDGVISGAQIDFYRDGTMRYTSSSLIGEQCYYGDYSLNQDTFKVIYLNETPKLEYTRMIESDKNLLFLDSNNEIGYEFHLDN